MSDFETLSKAFTETGVHWALGEHNGAKFIFLLSERETQEYRHDPEGLYRTRLHQGRYFEFGPEGDLWSYS